MDRMNTEMMKKYDAFRVLPWLLIFVLCGCATGGKSPGERKSYADSLAAQHGWEELRLQAGKFELAAYAPAATGQSDHLAIYFEGDGQAWISSSQPSFDPTPRNPVALELAVRHPGGAAAYLARPCQYVRGIDSACKQAFWTEKRFAPEVIEASNLAVDALKRRSGARRLVLVGYSGGGAVAALVAARRNDVDLLLTVAGNLDHAAWSAKHRISPLAGSLNPANEWQRLTNVRQVHYVGGRDTNIDIDVAQSYASRFSPESPLEVISVPDYDHHCCWGERWPELLAAPLSGIGR